jgi:hypothetical protein
MKKTLTLALLLSITGCQPYLHNGDRQRDRNESNYREEQRDRDRRRDDRKDSDERHEQYRQQTPNSYW